MSQFILFTNNKIVNLPINIESIDNNIIFQNIKKVISCCNVYTIKNFDAICVNAMEKINSNKTNENIELFKILKSLENEEIYLWYGNEINDLDEETTFDDLLNNVKESLRVSSGEIYIHYKKSL
jgi:hypothetical protein